MPAAPIARRRGGAPRASPNPEGTVTCSGGRRRPVGRVFVVLPAFNEASSIGELIGSIAEVLDEVGVVHHIIVVDDGSTDGTADVVRSASDRTWPEILVNERNLGLGGAMSRGLRRAVDLGRAGDVIVTLDADLTHDPVYIPRLLDAYSAGSDVVIASRFRRGSEVVGVPAHRRVLSLGVRAAAFLLAPVDGVRDYSCGYRLYDVRVLAAAMDGVRPGLITERGFGYTFEVLLGLKEWACFSEIPFVLRYDVKRKGSAIRIIPTVKSYAEIAWRHRRYGRSPRFGRNRRYGRSPGYGRSRRP